MPNLADIPLYRRRDALFEALLSFTEAQGFPASVAQRGLEAEKASWCLDALRRLLAELPPTARPPKRVLVIAARTLPVSALRQVFFARALGAEVWLKPASGQEALAEVLAGYDPGVKARPFASSDTAALDAALGGVDAVVVLGGDEAVASVRARLPKGMPMAAYGHKVSALWDDGGGPEVLVRAVEDLLAWQQEGCLAPQVLWTRDVARAGALLAEALMGREGWARPPSYRDRLLVAGLGGRLIETPAATLALMPDPAFRASPGGPFLWVLPLSEAALRPVLPSLSSLGVSGHPPALALPPSVRVIPMGMLQQPSLSWRQDGLHPLRSLVR